MALNTGAYQSGISAQPLDFGSIASNYMQSAVEQKLNEIKQNKAEIGGNMEKALKAMSITALPELSGKLREDYNKKIETYRADVINRFRQKEGKLGFEDQAAIESGAVQLANEMNMKKNMLEKYDAARKLPLQQGFGKTYNVKGYTEELAKSYESFLNGDYTEDPGLIPFKHVLPTDVDSEVLGYVKERMPFIDQTKNTTVQGGIQSSLQQTDPATIEQNIKDSFKTNSALSSLGWDQTKIDTYAKEKTPVYQQQILENNPYVPRRAGSGGSGGLAKRQEIYETQVYDPILKKTTNEVNFPTDLSRTPRPIMIGKAYDENGKLVDVNASLDAELVSFNRETGMIRVNTLGGQLKRDGNPLFSSSDISSKSIAEKKKGGETEQQIKNNAKNKLAGAEAAKWDDVTNVDVVKNEEGDWVLKGTLVKNKKEGSAWQLGFGGEEGKTKDVEVPLYPVSDEKAPMILKLPISDYKNLLTASDKKYKINGMSILDYAESGAQEVKPKSGFDPTSWKK